MDRLKDILDGFLSLRESMSYSEALDMMNQATLSGDIGAARAALSSGHIGTSYASYIDHIEDALDSDHENLAMYLYDRSDLADLDYHMSHILLDLLVRAYEGGALNFVRHVGRTMKNLDGVFRRNSYTMMIYNRSEVPGSLSTMRDMMMRERK